MQGKPTLVKWDESIEPNLAGHKTQNGRIRALRICQMINSQNYVSGKRYLPDKPMNVPRLNLNIVVGGMTKTMAHPNALILFRMAVDTN